MKVYNMRMINKLECVNSKDSKTTIINEFELSLGGFPEYSINKKRKEEIHKIWLNFVNLVMTHKIYMWKNIYYIQTYMSVCLLSIIYLSFIKYDSLKVMQ